MDLGQFDLIVVGAGVFGLTVAERAAQGLGLKVCVLEATAGADEPVPVRPAAKGWPALTMSTLVCDVAVPKSVVPVSSSFG